MAHRSTTLSGLKKSIRKIEKRPEKLAVGDVADKLTFGLSEIDNHLSGGLSGHGLHEVRCRFSKDIACACGVVCALFVRQFASCDESRLATNRGTILWIADPASGQDGGTPNPDGLRQLGLDPARLVIVSPLKLKDAIWAAGEAASLGNLAGIVVQVKGNPGLFDLSVSRKLSLRAEQAGVPVFVLRQAGEEEASSALTRWHVRPETSVPDQEFQQGVGAMRLTLTLERNRNGQTGRWQIAWNPKKRSFENAADTSEATHTGLPFHPSAKRPDRTQEMGQIVALDRAS